MPTLVRFLADDAALRPVTLVTGVETTLTDYAVQAVLARLRQQHEAVSVHHLDASRESPNAVLRLVNGYRPCLVVYGDLDARPGEDYAQLTSSLADGAHCVLVASAYRRPNGTVWLPAGRDRISVSCPREIDPEQTQQLLQRSGMSLADAHAVANSYAFPEAMQILDLLSAFPQPWQPGLYRQIACGIKPADDALAAYDVLQNCSDDALLRQLKRRLTQLALLSYFLPLPGLSQQDLCHRTGIEPWQLPRFRPLVAYTSPNDWIGKLAAVARAEPFARAQFPVRPYLVAALGLH